MSYRTIRHVTRGILLIILVFATVAWERAAYDRKQSDGDCLESLCFVIGNTAPEQKIRCFTENTEQTAYLFLPSYANAGDVKISFVGADRAVFAGGEEEISLKNGEDIGALVYDEPYAVCFYDREGRKTAQQTMVVMHSANLPALFLETESGSMEMLDADKNYEEKGRIILFDAGGDLVCADRLDRISGRGNSTWAYPKKSYGIKLKTRADLFGMGSADNWILLSNVEDRSYIRNKITYEMAIAAGMEGSPESQYIDLYVNNRYHGMYQLCEKVEIDPERIPVADLGEQNRKLNKTIEDCARFDTGDKKGVELSVEPAKLTGGYLLERDVSEKYVNEISGFRTTLLGDQYTIKNPKYASRAQVDYISVLMNDMEKAVTAADGVNPDTGLGYSDYIDLESYARKYIVEELSKNKGGGATSSFFYKPENKGLFAGPVWDYDKAYGRLYGIDGTTRDLCYLTQRDGTTTLFWYLNTHPEFRQMVSSCYQAFFSDYFQTIQESKIDEYVSEIYVSANMDRIRWKEIYGEVDFSGEIWRIRDFLSARKAFLDEVWIERKELCTVHFIAEEYHKDMYVSVIRAERIESLPIGEPGHMDADRVFDGWYTEEGELFDGTAPILEDLTVYGRSHISSGAE